MAKCTLCGNNVQAGKGKIFVRISGEVTNFCNSKCQKNWNLKREGKNLKWTKKFVKG